MRHDTLLPQSPIEASHSNPGGQQRTDVAFICLKKPLRNYYSSRRSMREGLAHYHIQLPRNGPNPLKLIDSIVFPLSNYMSLYATDASKSLVHRICEMAIIKR